MQSKHSMTEYEIIDLINSSQQTTIAASMAFVTLCSAYVVAVHLVARKLPIFFLILLTVGYSLWVIMPMVGMYTTTNRIVELVAQLAALQENVPYVEPDPIFFNTAILAFFWASSVMYMIYVRRAT